MTTTNDQSACGRCKHYEVGGHNVAGQVAGFCKQHKACITLSIRRRVRKQGCDQYAFTEHAKYKVSNNSWRAGKSTNYAQWLENETVRLKILNSALVCALEKVAKCDQFTCAYCRASINIALNLAKEP